MSAPTIRTLASVIHGIPLELKTIYNGHSSGRLPWVSRSGPDGRRTRELWVDVSLLEDWAAARGISINVRDVGRDRRH